MTAQPMHGICHHRQFVCTAALVSLVTIGNCSGPTASAADLFNTLLQAFDRRAETAKAEEPDENNQYFPLLQKVLNTEMYFINKVCQPAAEQTAAIRAAGRIEIIALAKLMATKQVHMPDWPDARQILTEGLAKKVDEVLPAEAAQKYRRELAARENAKREAAAAMMVYFVDQDARLSIDQAQQLEQTLLGNWKPEWSRNLQVFNYSQYAPQADAALIRSVLNDRQKKLWKARADQGRIHFGWEQDLGVTGWIGDIHFGDEPPAEGQEK